MLVTKPSDFFPQPESGIFLNSSFQKPWVCFHVHQQINTQLGFCVVIRNIYSFWKEKEKKFLIFVH